MPSFESAGKKKTFYFYQRISSLCGFSKYPSMLPAAEPSIKEKAKPCCHVLSLLAVS